MKWTGAVAVSGVFALLGACSSDRVYGDCDGFGACAEGGEAGEASNPGPQSGGAAGAGGSAASGGDAGSGVGGDAQPGVLLEVVSVSPEDEAAGVATEDTSVSATFSQALGADTLTGESFAVSVRGNAVDGELSVENATAIFTPAAPLFLLSEYQVSLAGSIADAEGNGLSNPPYTWAFSTADGSWKDWEEIELDSNNARESEVAVDALGNAIVVWRQQNPSAAFDVWANRYDLETGWGEPVMLDIEEGSTYYPQIALDSQGNAVAVWHQMVGNQVLFQVWAATFSPDEGWADAHLVKPATEDSTQFDTAAVAFDDAGHAIVVWSETDGFTSDSARVWANRLTWANRESITGGWGNAATVDTDLVRGRSKVRLRMDAPGNAVVTWQETESMGSSVWANRFDIESGWGEAAELHYDETGLYNMALAGNRKGEAVCLTVTADQLMAARFVPGEGWDEKPTPVGNPGDAVAPVAAMDDHGNTIATWTSDGDLWASRYVPGDGWGEPEKIDAPGADEGYYSSVAVDPDGNALAAWEQDSDIWFNRFTVTEGWGEPQALEPDENTTVTSVSVAVSESGRAAITWQQEFSIVGAAFR